MELWVRSQDKMSLIAPECIQYIFIEGGNTHYIIGSGVNLGVYDSKERCLEILDEIQKIITDSNKTLVTLENELDVRDYDELLYELEKGKIAFVNNAQNAQVFPLQANIVYEMPEK